MKNTILKNIVMAFSIGVFAALAGTSASGQSDQSSRARKMEGVWNLQVTRVNCQTGAVIANFPAMHMYVRGGTMEDFGTQNSPTLRGPGYGTWTYDAQEGYSLTFQFFRFNPDGTLAGRNVARQVNELSDDGNSLTQTSIAQAFDVNGNLIGTNCATAVGVRF